MNQLAKLSFTKNKIIMILLVIMMGIGLLAINHPGYAQHMMHSQKDESSSTVAPLLDGMGDYQRIVTTSSEHAKRYFDQGLTLSYAFHHNEAARSFRHAIQLDPEFAMAHWGLALVLGPNINARMSVNNIEEAFTASRKALELSENESPENQALIQALQHRYDNIRQGNRDHLDLAYADAMRDIAKKYPDDPDIVSLCAEALMDLHPWDYWTRDGQAQAWTPEIVDLLEAIMVKHPRHVGANHLYIHAIEASPHPEKALRSAELLEHLVPGAGHLVHMPSHIYVHVGRFRDGVASNLQAIKADQYYEVQCRTQGVYPLSYMPHNPHFLWYCAIMCGDLEQAIFGQVKTRELLSQDHLHHSGYGALQHMSMLSVYTHIRFSQWDAILEEELPHKAPPYIEGVWRFARGLAYVHTGDLKAAQAEQVILKQCIFHPKLRHESIWTINQLKTLLQIANHILMGEMHASEGNLEDAVLELTQAIDLEYQLNYNEPPDWVYPARHTLGRIYLEANKPEDAERIFREDLEVKAENGWALFGLYQALKDQGKEQESKEVWERFVKGWANHKITPWGDPGTTPE